MFTWDSGFRVKGKGLGSVVSGPRFKTCNLGIRIGFWVFGLGFLGVGFRV